MATIVIREIEIQAYQSLSSHVSSSQSAVHCPAFSLDAPIGSGLSPSYMVSDDEAGTAVSPDHNTNTARLQTLEAADQVRNVLIYLWSSTFAAVVSTAWLEIPPTQRTGRPVAVSTTKV